MSRGTEWTEVEAPFLDQLASMGWKTVLGSLDHPSVTGRESFREVLLKADLRRAIERIDLRDGQAWTRVRGSVAPMARDVQTRT